MIGGFRITQRDQRLAGGYLYYLQNSLSKLTASSRMLAGMPACLHGSSSLMSDPECAPKIRAYTKNGLRYAFDCITSRESMQICYASLGRVGGRYTALDPYPADVATTRKIIKAD
ncbi:hypothetical protein GQ44DRAFT_715601 [Phaeosphaeriaceae sp. PMI808]|nr:hypothetical protein GQ44DRAFT_715601 [Phaeosphaeriaceae sp. PMI808]